MARAEDEVWMKAAMRQAALSRERGDLGVGAAIVAGGKLLAEGGNEVRSSGDLTAHAEIVALRQLRLGSAPSGLTLYATFEPCPMCAGAALVAGVTRIVMGGVRDRGDKTWGEYSPVLYGRFRSREVEPMRVEHGPLHEECIALRGGASGGGR